MQMSCLSLGLYSCVAWSCLRLLDPNLTALLQTKIEAIRQEEARRLADISHDLDTQINELSTALSKERDNMVRGQVEGPRYVVKKRDLQEWQAKREKLIADTRLAANERIERVRAQIASDPNIGNRALNNMSSTVAAVFHVYVDPRALVFLTALLLAILVESAIYGLWFALAAELPLRVCDRDEDPLAEFEAEVSAELRRQRFENLLRKVGLRVAAESAISGVRRTTRNFHRTYTDQENS